MTAEQQQRLRLSGSNPHHHSSHYIPQQLPPHPQHQAQQIGQPQPSITHHPYHPAAHPGLHPHGTVMSGAPLNPTTEASFMLQERAVHPDLYVSIEIY